MTDQVINFLGWLFISFGMLTLTEGYHAFRQRVAGAERPGRYWWVAGLIWAVGLSLIAYGLKVDRTGGF